MNRCQGNSNRTVCPECDIGPFKRNHYFTGKLLVERDFTDEQRYYIDKLRHHHQRLHGKGVVCGLKVTQHGTEECQDRYLCIQPGTAIDCCGREIVVLEPECIDITRFQSVKALFEEEPPENGGKHILQVCIRYKECPTEEVPVLYDECGCDENQCAPNRILESWELDVLVIPQLPEEAERGGDENCCEPFWDSLDGCKSCDTGDCIVLATIQWYRPGFSFNDMPERRIEGDSDFNNRIEGDSDFNNKIARINNRKGRQLLPSTQMLTEAIQCLCDREAGTEGGEGLEEGLTRIVALSWKHGEEIDVRDRLDLDKLFIPVKRQDGSVNYGLVIGFGDADGNKQNVQVTVGRSKIDASHVFQVMFPVLTTNPFDDPLNKSIRWLFECHCLVKGKIIPVDYQASNDEVKKAWEVAAEEGIAPGCAFVFDDELYHDAGFDDFISFFNNYVYQMRRLKRQEIEISTLTLDLWIRLRSDFVIDEQGHAIDAEFIRAELPTGDGRNYNKVRKQGGLFESWFSIHVTSL